jgi:FecR protein
MRLEMNSLMKAQLCIIVLLVGSSNVFAGVAGNVLFVNGEVKQLSSAGKTHLIKKGEAINEGDTLTSAPAASAQIKMEDGGLIALRSDTQIKFDQFNFNGQQDGTEKSFLSLVKGGFRAVTGLIGKVNKNNYRIHTPSAVIGIRGTDHETFVVVPGSALATKSPVGTYNKVNSGETTMNNDKGSMSVLPNQMCFVGSADQMPVIQAMDTNIFTVTSEPQGEAKQYGEVRDTAVVDGALETQRDGLQSSLPNDPVVLRPIKGKSPAALQTAGGGPLEINF